MSLTDFDKIYIGIEQEHFAFKNNRPPQYEEIQQFFRLMRQRGYAHVHNGLDGVILFVSKQTEFGTIKVSNDFCTHIIEASLPPLINPSQIRQLFINIWTDISESLLQLGISLQYGASLSTKPDTLIVDRNNRYDLHAKRQRPTPYSRLWDPLFTTMMCATQIHLEIIGEQFYRALPTLYSYEYISPLLFSNSSSYLGEIMHCIRPMVWQNAFSKNYYVFGYPEQIPTSKDAYNSRIADSIGFIRDYSFIAPREFGTAEFRSTCSQNSVDDVLLVAAFRLLSWITAVRVDDSDYSQPEMRGHFLRVCQTGKPDINILQNHISNFEKSEKCWPKQWCELFNIIIFRLKTILSNSVSL